LVDDTDNITADRAGKLARWFEKELPEGCRVEGVVRQQLLVDDRIPYTSHNSSACVMVDAPTPLGFVAHDRAIEHLEAFLEGSDPDRALRRGTVHWSSHRFRPHHLEGRHSEEVKSVGRSTLSRWHK
jgi:hypothetical protein